MRKTTYFLLLGSLLLLVACGKDALPTFTIAPEYFGTPTPFPATSTHVIQPTDTATLAPLAATATPAPPADTATPPASPTPIPSTDTPTPPAYRVAYVRSDDVLNVRENPGVEHTMIGSLPPHGLDVKITGTGSIVEPPSWAPSLWVPIQSGDVTGWVNSRYLTGQVAKDFFCEDARTLGIIDALKAAIANQDGEALAELLHPFRGLRLRFGSSNEVMLTAEEARSFFTSSESYDWGIGGRGSIRSVLVPPLEKDLLGATDLVCGELVGGGGAGTLQLPFEYQPVNFYTLHRPVADGGAPGDWGSWVVGIDYWQGQPYLAFLVHFGA
jgi:hypothetical protein